MNERYTHIDEILEKIRRDTGFEDVVKDEVKEWIWEVIGVIGCVESFERKLATISCTNWRGVLPEDFYEIAGIRETETMRPFIEACEIYHKNQKPYEANLHPNYTTNEHSTYIDANGNEVTNNETTFIAGIATHLYPEEYTYKLSGNYIYLGKQNAEIEIAYDAFPVSPDGTPAIPNNAKYINAVAWFCAEKIAMRMKIKNEIARDDYWMIHDKYTFAAGQVKGYCKMPSIDKMESIKNRSMRLIPTINEHRSGFRYLGFPESLNNI